MKVWLGEKEVKQYLDVTDTTRRIAFGLDLRSGLCGGERLGDTRRPDRRPRRDDGARSGGDNEGRQVPQDAAPPDLATTFGSSTTSVTR